MKFLLKRTNKAPIPAMKVLRSKKQLERHKRFSRDYAVIIYHKDETYPSGSTVEEVSDILENVGVRYKNRENKVGRPKKKVWPYSQKVRNRFYRRKWRNEISKIGRLVARKKLRTYYNGFQKFGRLVVEQLQDEIKSIQEPKLEPTTIKMKGSSKPLIDTKRLLNSIRYKVVKTKGRYADEIRKSDEYVNVGKKKTQ